MNTQLKKVSILFLVGFIIYMCIEVIFNAINGNLVGLPIANGTIKYWSLIGNTSIFMGFLGGFLFYILGKLNEVKWIKNNVNMFFQCLIGAVIVTIAELIAGVILNIHFDLAIWDYSDMPFNFLGQINLLYCVFWFLLVPFAFWLDDILRWVFYEIGLCNETNGIYNLFWLYTQIFNWKKIDYVGYKHK